MKAILATRCGCQQTYVISYPPPPKIMLPLHESREWAVKAFDPAHAVLPADPVSPVEVREFVLVGRPLSPNDTAHYAEV
jgi:hypothetical protein